MMQWVLMAALLLAAAALATRPWWAGGARATLKRRNANKAAYRTRLAELETEREAGLVGAADAEALKAELGARLLNEVAGDDPTVQSAAGRRWLAAVLATVLLAIFAATWYSLSGSWKAQAQLAAGAAQSDQVAQMVQQLAEKMQREPENPEGWAMLGRSYFVMQRFADAAKAYAEANQRSAEPNPEWLAGQGEALAFARDRDLQGTPAQLFDQALAVAPDYGKALWYAGLAAAQAGDNDKARQHWARLLDDPDLPPQMRQTLQAHLQDLGGQGATPPLLAAAGAQGQGRAAPPSGPAVRLKLHLSLAPELAGKVPPGPVLFLYAKAESGPPMPLAVQRLPGQTLPVDLSLDDSMAMAPALRLSAFERYIVTARLSAGGGAQAQSGDLEGSLHAARADSGKVLDLRIDHVVP